MNKACLSSKKCVASTSRLVAATQNKVRPTHTQHTHTTAGGFYGMSDVLIPKNPGLPGLPGLPDTLFLLHVT